jgi:hypothetical protein
MLNRNVIAVYCGSYLLLLLLLLFLLLFLFLWMWFLFGIYTRILSNMTLTESINVWR